jgi:tetratricopeptide (TPR) repeat protein
MARVDSLAERAKGILQTGAVVGREFTYDLINRLMGLREQELLSNLSALKDSELVYERGIYPQSTYIFKHALTQEVVYDSLLLKKRKEIHEKTGEAIEELYPDRIEEFYEMLAYHYSRSDNLRKTYEYLKFSGQKADRNYSTWEAFRFYNEAIQILKKEQETEENLKEQLEILHLNLGPMRVLGFPEDSLQMLQEGLKLSKEIGNEKDFAIFHSVFGWYLTLREGKPLLAVEYSEKSFQVAQRIGDIELIVRTAYHLSPSYVCSGQFFKILEMAPHVIDLIQKTEKESESFGAEVNLYSALNTYYGWSLGWCGNFEEGEIFLEKGLRFAADINHRNTLALIELIFGFFFNAKGEGENAIKHFLNSIKYIQEVKYLHILGAAWTGLGWGYYFLGELETARKHIEKGLKIQSNAGISYHMSRGYFVLNMVHFDSGDLEGARSCAEKALQLSRNGSEKHFEACSRIWLGRTLGRAGTSGAGRVEEHILEGIKILDELRLRPFSAQGHLFLGELYADGGQREKAQESLKKAEAMFQEMAMDYWLAKTQEVLGRL